MRTNILRSVAVALSIGACTTAQAQYGEYKSPSRWNNFNVNRAPSAGNDFFQTVAAGDKKAAGAAKKAAPAPLPEPLPEAPVAQQLPTPAVGSGTVAASDCVACQSSPYMEAMQAGPALARPPLAPWFGGSNLLFLTVENNSDRTLVFDDATGTRRLSTADADVDATTGFDIFAGRYFGCGRYGLSVGYFLFNPEEASRTVLPGAAGDYRAAMPSWNSLLADPGPISVYDHFDLAPAAGYRVRRDMKFQGIEANLSIFGLMGAQRAAARCGVNTPLGHKLARFGRGYGYGGTGGPIVRACNGRVSMVASHGFRWFQLEDEFEFGVNIDGSVGYQPTDMFYNVDTENNLYGYQFGGRVNYCLGRRLMLGIGGKIGIYGNSYEIRQRIGIAGAPAYTAAGDNIDTKVSDTALASLGELDLGLGYRLTNAWVIRGGYRLIGATGVATSTGSIPANFSTIDMVRETSADDSVIVHGGYVGLEFNW